MRIGTGTVQPCWIKTKILFTTAVFIQFHRTLRTRTLHGVRSKVRNENSAIDLTTFWIKTDRVSVYYTSESELPRFVGDLIGEIAGVWLSLISASMPATPSSFGVAIEF